MKKAIVSVSNKSNLADFLQALQKDFSFLSTGGTFQHLCKHNIKCSRVEDYTGFPEILGGRVKSLHPKIYAGILSLRKKEEQKMLSQQKIEHIEMVVVNFYPFVDKLKKNLSLSEMLEFIDIGGPSLLRAAAKNYPFVLPVCDPQDYDQIIKHWQSENIIPLSLRKKLAAKAFLHCSQLDAQISEYLSDQPTKTPLRYGENPHQKAYVIKKSHQSLGALQKLQGKELSYNNYLDLQAAMNVISDFTTKEPLTVVIKHNNPCGIANGKNARQSLEMAWECDVVSAFGSVIATNSTVTLDFAKFLVDPDFPHFQYSWQNNCYQKTKIHKKFFEILMAPHFEKAALELLQTYAKNAILLQFEFGKPTSWKTQFLDGICLEQERDNKQDKFCLVTTKKFPKSMQKLAEFGVVCSKHAKSNAVALVKEYLPQHYQLFGLGCGQPNRIDALVKLALPKAEENFQRIYSGTKENFTNWLWEQKKNLLLVSDAFLPFKDIVEAAHYHNICYIVQPGGSKRDQDSIDFCNQHKMAMLFNGLRHFQH